MMLAVSAPLSYKNERENYDLFQDFADGNLIDTIDFDDLFEGIDDGDLLPDLDILAEFSVSSSEESDSNNNNNNNTRKEEVEKAPSSEHEHKREESATNVKTKESKENDKAKKSSGQIKNPEGKRKVKVDWTPELHRRFVKAVEQLGVDKAVPSRILELMATDGLTRHNIASHLQKYRAHRKHLLAREAEAASWSQRKQMYGGAAVGGGGRRDMMNPWPAPPTMGFPPMPHIRPLHVWGHPPRNNSFWHLHYQGVTNSLTPGTPCFPAPIAPTRFAAPLMVPGIPPPPAIIKVDNGVRHATPKLPSDYHPSKESIDAALEDVLSKPQLPQLPIGLKPPSIDSVLNELQRQGITKIPPT